MAEVKNPEQANRSRRLGRSSVELRALGLGCAGIAGLFQDVSEAQALATVDAAWMQGVRYFDTAPYYGYSKSEHRLGIALRQRPRDEFVLSTKVGRLMKPCAGGNSHGARDGWDNPLPFEPVYDYTRDGILRSFEDSLQRLGVARIDVLLVHDIDIGTHGERHGHYWRQLTDGGFGALDELRSANVVGAVGLGVNDGGVILDAMREFDLDCALLAGRYTLLEQGALDAVLPECLRRGVDIILGGVFNSGILAQGVTANRDASRAADLKFNYGSASLEVIERVSRIEAVCAKFGVSLRAAALQFPYAHAAVACLLTGARSPQELDQNVQAFAAPIPTAFWQAMREQGLLRDDAPTP
ncbi:MAG TPA: aldo/keto reductase [Trinickia sp.]|jgi:D-threo-aldose 1-dehydrogenase|nr:aldo/keto reductase [Trinickia sp.]